MLSAAQNVESQTKFSHKAHQSLFFHGSSIQMMSTNIGLKGNQVAVTWRKADSIQMKKTKCGVNVNAHICSFLDLVAMVMKITNENFPVTMATWIVHVPASHLLSRSSIFSSK